MNSDKWIDSAAANLSLLEEVYSKYKENPASVDAAWRPALAALESETTYPSTRPSAMPNDLRVYNLIEAYRKYGHLMAKINPIATHSTEEPWQLNLEKLGFTSQELEIPFPTYGIMSAETAPLKEIIQILKGIYCDKIGVEYMGLQNPQLEEWVQRQIESNRFKIDLSIEQKKMILQQLNRSELFESFIHTRYPGQKRFSLEGGETLIPMLEAVIETGGKLGVEECIIGMAHRGRLNVLSNILNKSHTDIFSEFEDNWIPNSIEGSGDVKYHKGFTAEVKTPNNQKMRISLSPNPSHLESVDPVVEGQARARQIYLKDDIKQEKVVPILVHGDAALAGQGVIYETLQLYRLPGYSTGGAIHLVINNQIGFTATPEESRSTQYCTDIARAFDAPVFHVNAEDPEACVYATILAVELRQKFHCDVFVDLNCYRKYGHNETDEPAFTQPLEYQLIRKKRPIREIYRDQLIHQGVVEKHIAEGLETEFTKALHQAMEESKAAPRQAPAPNKNGNGSKGEVLFASIATAVPKATLQAVAQRFCSVPEGFNIHPKLQHLLKERLSMVADGEKVKPIDWGMGELLAYGTLLWEGIPVRLSGQDSPRGTFSHRHAVWMDQVVEKAYSPLNNLKTGQGRFDALNSPLSEFAILGFEFGYSFAYPEALVIWEAQFGDFCNGAQVIIDQYISPSEQKWGQKLGLALLLPHGYEGQGPEHSSARVERFLSLCGEDNMRIVNPTTPAQLFHLLRKQTLNPIRKPLIIFTPKGLLRHPACTSVLSDLTDGMFQEILDDPTPGADVKRLIFCMGRVYYDLIAERAAAGVKDLAIVRLEQLYPLNTEKLTAIIKKYSGVKEAIWVQEEPYNMGAWDFIHPLLQALLPKTIELKYIGRKRSASPAVGSHVLHKKQYAEIMAAVFGALYQPKG